MPESPELAQLLKLTSSENYVSREEFFKLIDYLLLSQLNAQTSLQTGSASNQKLRDLFLRLLAILQPTVFCDIGSRDGESAIQVNHLLPDCECYGFEANPKIYEQFYSKVKDISPNVNYLNLAIGDVNHPVKLFAPKTITKVLVENEIIEVNTPEPEDTGRTSLLRRNEDITYEEFEVQCFRLDEYWVEQKVNITKQRLALWIDVEGAADKVLLGANQSLQQAAIVFIEVEGIEFWKQQQQGHDIARSLIHQGFIPIARDREYYDKQFNLLFVKQDYLEVVYPALFNLKDDLNATKLIYDVQNIYERVDIVEDFLNESLEECLNPILQKESTVKNKLNNKKNDILLTPIFSNTYTLCHLPIYIPCFNNLTYLKNTIEQLHRLECHNIIVLNNASTYPPLLQYFQEIEKEIVIIHLPENHGPHFVFSDNLIYSFLPPYFCLTDPDLTFNSSLPSDFMDQLLQLTEEFKVGKAGFALDISQPDLMVEEEFLIDNKHYKIWEWESQFWKQSLRENIYKAELDTTFAVYNKKYFDRRFPTKNAVRVGSNFVCRHLPWYQDNLLPSDEEKFYRKTSRYSYYLKENS
uniref:FkbM family methyltransferase n=1 Tax=Trichocoleus desertorum TaxID=1481672 RepID=UPI0025B3F2D3|nr:FkbM family methyltransferase [Trichocoleus desertorum]